MRKDPTYLKLFFHPQQLARSVAVGLVVGTILNLINQGDVLFGEAELSLSKLALTYLVPFAVASYASIRTMRRIQRGAASAKADD